MKFLRNRWYPAAWSKEVSAKPLGRKILGEDITFFRAGAGKAAAVASRCPHRFAPLHFGDVVGDNIKCRYHGLQFSATTGACTVNPDGSKPPSVSVKAYKVVDKDAMLWIWMGDQEPSVEPPDVLKLPENMGGFVTGYLHVKSHFQLLTDNLMDNAHATHLHAIFKTDAAIKHPKQEVRQDGDVVYSTTWAPNEPPNPFFHMLSGKGDPVDQWVDFKWEAPATVRLNAGATPTDRPRSEGVEVVAMHLMTPETAKTTHYFWGTGRNCKLEDHALSEGIRASFQKVFTEEDKWIMEAQEELMNGQEFWLLKPALLPQDKATALVRKYVEKLIAEQGAK
jgi:phenylpropionate dioxygenase-like ring-hydroxylating dioxygenase large terminal subunit